MTSITAEARNELVALVVGMFNAAPGANNLSSLVAMVESGKKLTDVAKVLTARAEFTAVYPATLSSAEFATRLAANLLGSEAGTTTTQWAIHWAETQLAAGKDRASVITTAVQSLLASTNADFANAKAMLNNKVDVASYYSVSVGANSTSLATLQAVISEVSSNSVSVPYAKNFVLELIGLIDYATKYYSLTAGIDSITGTDGGPLDTIFDLGTGLSAFDSIDGRAGSMDTLTLDDSVAIAIPATATVKNVEIAKLISSYGVSGDVSGWTGLTTLNVTSTTGTVAITAAATTNVIVSSTSAAGNNISVVGGNKVSVIITGIAANGSAFTTITDPHTGMKLSFGQAAGTPAFTTAKVALPANASFQDSLDAAAAGDGAAYSKVTWFQYLGNTYVVEDNSASSTYQNSTDTLVKLTGMVDLGLATFASITGASASLTLT